MEANSIYLYWETATEIIHRFFIVEKSSDAENWHVVKTIACDENAFAPLQFFYTDKNLQPGKYYYRLKRINKTGNDDYSNIVSAEIAVENTDIYVSDADDKENQLYIGGVTNVTEWEVSALSAEASLALKPALLNGTILNIPEVNSGIYLIKLKNKADGTTKTIRFVKK